MKNDAGIAGPSAAFDATRITETIRRSLACAGLDSQSGLVQGIMGTINQSLTTAGLMRGSDPQTASQRGTTIEGTARRVEPAIASPDVRATPAANDAVALALQY